GAAECAQHADGVDLDAVDAVGGAQPQHAALGDGAVGAAVVGAGRGRDDPHGDRGGRARPGDGAGGAAQQPVELGGRAGGAPGAAGGDGVGEAGGRLQRGGGDLRGRLVRLGGQRRVGPRPTDEHGDQPGQERDGGVGGERRGRLGGEAGELPGAHRSSADQRLQRAGPGLVGGGVQAEVGGQPGGGRQQPQLGAARPRRGGGAGGQHVDQGDGVGAQPGDERG